MLLCLSEPDFSLPEKQSMAKIVCDQLAELTSRCANVRFLKRLVFLKNLCEEWESLDGFDANTSLPVVSHPSNAMTRGDTVICDAVTSNAAAGHLPSNSEFAHCTVLQGPMWKAMFKSKYFNYHLSFTLLWQLEEIR